MRYFSDRSQVGQLLAEKLEQYSNKNCAIVCLSEGGILIGLEIAKKLHSSLYYLTTEDVELPGEPEPLATLSGSGSMTYNKAYSSGELESLDNEFHNFVEGKRIEAFHRLNRVSKSGGAIPKALLKNHVVILVSDGFRNGLSLDVAADFLKTVKTSKLIVATAIASVPAVDKMHLVADEIYCLGVADDFIDINHYYESNDLPSRAELDSSMDKVILEWSVPQNPAE